MQSQEFDLQSVLARIMGDEPLELQTKTVVTTTTVTAPLRRPTMMPVHEMTAGEELDESLARIDAAKVTKVVTPARGGFIVGTHSSLEPEDEASTVGAGLVSFPQFTSESIAEAMDMRNYATLCRLKVRKWVGKKRDKSAARDAEGNHGSVNGTFSVYKKLFAGTEDKLRAVNSVLDAARTRHYQMTLPWSTTGMDDAGRRDGPRLLANTLFMEYITEMGAAKQAMEQSLNELEAALPQMMSDAKRNLGKAFDITQYPDITQIRGMFTLDFEFSPIPEGADYKGLPQAQCAKLKEKLDKARTQCLENAMRDVWDRTYTLVHKMAERLGNPKHMFHDTLVSNMREMADLLRHLNAVNDATIETIRKRIQEDLCRFEPKVLREDMTKRALVAKLAREIISDMEAKGVRH